MAMHELVIVQPGMQSSVQDLGRRGWGAMGVSSSGAADSISLRIGNRLLGNADEAAAFEMTMNGATVRFTERSRIVLTGAAALEARIERTKMIVPAWRVVELERDDELRIGPITSGARVYLCIAGGIHTQPILGSRSTHVATGLGRCTGLACRAGERLPIGSRAAAEKVMVSQRDMTSLIHELHRRTFRIVRGPDVDILSPQAIERLVSTGWTISPRSDRMGLRLTGASLGSGDGQHDTEGVTQGMIQVTPDGTPIILGVDAAPTGGYPVIASVIEADMSALGQRQPGDVIRFQEVMLEEARHLIRAQRTMIAASVFVVQKGSQA